MVDLVYQRKRRMQSADYKFLRACLSSSCFWSFEHIGRDFYQPSCHSCTVASYARKEPASTFWKTERDWSRGAGNHCSNHFSLCRNYHYQTNPMLNDWQSRFWQAIQVPLFTRGAQKERKCPWSTGQNWLARLNRHTAQPIENISLSYGPSYFQDHISKVSWFTIRTDNDALRWVLKYDGRNRNRGNIVSTTVRVWLWSCPPGCRKISDNWSIIRLPITGIDESLLQNDIPV